jgi:hypothetical protein
MNPVLCHDFLKTPNLSYDMNDIVGHTLLTTEPFCSSQISWTRPITHRFHIGSSTEHTPLVLNYAPDLARVGYNSAFVA